MKRYKSASEYPEDWEQLADSVKNEADWKCERCGHVHEPRAGYCLTVHHLDGNKKNSSRWNLAALCQRCHLQIQSRVIMDQMLFDFVKVSDWFKPHLEGYKKSKCK